MSSSKSIPIKNIYYILLYAWDKVKDLSIISEKTLEKIGDINYLIMELFLREVQKLISKGLYRDYLGLVKETRFIKGKIHLNETMKLIRPNIVCEFDEYSHNLVYNQIIKSILIRISSLEAISGQDKRKINNFLRLFSSIDPINLEGLNKNLLDFNRYNKDYEHTIDLGLLLYANSIPSEVKGKYRLMDLMDNEVQMSSIYEEFLRKFYEVHSDYRVGRSYYYHNWSPLDRSNIDLLPRMETDLELTALDQKIIIDAKYYRSAFSRRFEARKLISHNIYQMQTYLLQNVNKYKDLRGILLYPSNGYTINERFYSDLGFTIEFHTVDLNKEWKEIQSRLLDIIKFRRI